MSVFQKDFDALLNDLLTDYRNQFPEADTSQGSLLFIMAACLASALWGLYKYQDWIANQLFPDTADSANLEHHAWMRGLSRKIGETDAELLDRLLSYIRKPPAGGNKHDYVKWILDIGNTAAGYCYPLAQGVGSVDVVVLASEAMTGSEVPSSHTRTGAVTGVSPGKLVDAAADFLNAATIVRVGDVARNTDSEAESIVTLVTATELTLSADIFTAAAQGYAIDSLIEQVRAHINDVRPVTANVLRVLPPTIVAQDVTMTVTGAGADRAAIAADVEELIQALWTGDTLYRSQLMAAAIRNGADNVVVTAPAADVAASTAGGVYEMIRPGTITIN